MKPTPDAFEQWRHSPVTEWFMDAFLKAEMERTKKRLQDRAWESIVNDDDWYSCRERYDTLDWVRSLDMEIIEQMMEMQE